MENSLFVNLLKTTYCLSENAEKLLQIRIKKEWLPKGSAILRPGEVCRYIYFVEKGFLRHFKMSEHIEYTTDFVCQGHFCTAIDSIFTQRQSEEGILCETDCVLYALNYYDLMALEDITIEFTSLYKQLICHYLSLINQERDLYRWANATSRYEYLCQNYPNINRYVKRKDIASYLGITQQSLSRILHESLTKR
ncbi:Cyclic nucleotide-binding domain protein [compost metagenome]|uniref:cAMP-binding domain of CRP or a regulatory subunit of cAMP-dependent protein kinases n=1 Tax=Pedobacter xixiisoli TaxID=1476464 RepID=A0A285ZZQ3_9SPHI|nr:Crp/Fnr family transcriptional regulator [Pedobacter xixiisoli]SOD15125.1 cAMP-binding domain of CRP or a regulatory subunit of cAMP-dependent protein kinases [Pedobacter xixiisoli]